MRRLGITHLERSASGWLHSKCPLAPWTHASGSDKHPSFGVKPEPAGLSAYMCFSCKHHGRISSLVRLLQHLGADVGPVDGGGYPVLAKDADMFDARGIVGLPFRDVEQQDEKPDPLEEVMFDGIYMPAWDVPESREYLRSRGVGAVAAEALQLGWDPDQRRVVFPVRDREGSLYGHTGRAVDQQNEPKVKDYHGLPKMWLILGQHRWRGQPGGTRPLILVEGLFAYAHLVEMNLEQYADVGALMGSRLTEHQAEEVKVHNCPTYLLMDNDPAGEQALFGRVESNGDQDFQTGAVAALLGHLPVHVPAWPEGKTDPDELTKTEVWRMLQQTPPYRTTGG